MHKTQKKTYIHPKVTIELMDPEGLMENLQVESRGGSNKGDDEDDYAKQNKIFFSNDDDWGRFGFDDDE